MYFKEGFTICAHEAKYYFITVITDELLPTWRFIAAAGTGSIWSWLLVS